MKKLLFIFLMATSIFADQAELEAWQGSPLTANQSELIDFLLPIKILNERGRIQQVNLCEVHCIVEQVDKAMAIPEQFQLVVYGQLVPDITIEQLSISSKTLPDGRFAFVCSANYNLAPKPPSRETYTSADDAKIWVDYLRSIGFTNFVSRATLTLIEEQ